MKFKKGDTVRSVVPAHAKRAGWVVDVVPDDRESVLVEFNARDRFSPWLAWFEESELELVQGVDR